MPNDTTPAPILSDYIEGDGGLGKEIKKSRRTIERWRSLGEAPPFVRVGRTIYYHRPTVAAWLAARQTEMA